MEIEKIDEAALARQIDPGLLAFAKQQEKAKDDELAREAAQVVDLGSTEESLSSWGYSSPLKITKGEKSTYIRLKIKSVGVQDVIEQTEKRQPRPPSTHKSYKKGSAEAQELGSPHGIIVREVDYSDPAYMAALDEHNRRTGVFIVLAGLMEDWKDEGGNFILKGSDPNTPNQILDEEKCIQKFKKLRFTSAHFTTVVRDIRRLTEDEEVRESRE